LQTRKRNRRNVRSFLENKTFQKLFIGFLTVLISFALVENGAVSKKYKLVLGEPSGYDITAPRDIENKLLTVRQAELVAEAVSPVMLRLENVPLDTINTADEFINEIEKSRINIERRLKELGITPKTEGYQQALELEQQREIEQLEIKIAQFNVPLTREQVGYLVATASDNELAMFDKLTKNFISSVLKEEVTEENLAAKVDYIQREYHDSELSQEFKIIGSLMAKAFLKPNCIVDAGLTEQKKKEAYEAALENKQMITAGSRILSYGDIVTEDKLEVLKELNLLETGKLDFYFSGGILAAILVMAALLVLYLKFFYSKILTNNKELILLCFIINLCLLSAWLIGPFLPLLIPVFVAPMLISILIDLKLALFVNFLLSLAVFFITKGNLGFLYTSLLGGSFSAFIVSETNQRSKLPISGLLTGIINAAVITCINLINKNDAAAIAREAALVAVNGMLSTIFTIGALPFFESTFNIVTPLKLLELTNPNQPLIKKLLMEAPGTYHHSLMVGNLAEVATEAIKGNALLARVGAYYHDVGKLKRPNFFKENQLSDNPHDKMNPSLSTLVITSHTIDGVEIAAKYKMPHVVRNIISQHHGTTMVAYFYYKAQKSDRTGSVKPEDFRYQGPKPSSKEAAVVMLADSVEAAVRSMTEKTEGKMEGLIRKIIKDKLDDGQLDHCDLTLKDLDTIARSFIRVFSGYFHERQEYPEIKNQKLREDKNGVEPDAEIAEKDDSNYEEVMEKIHEKMPETNNILSSTNERTKWL